MITVIRDKEQMLQLKSSWDALARNSRIPLLQYDWFFACAEAACPPGQLYIVLNGTTKDFSAVAPCIRVRQKGCTRLEVLGSSFLFEPTGFLYDSEQALDEILDYLVSQDAPLILRRFGTDSLEVSRIPAACDKRQFLQFRLGSTSPWLPIETTWEKFEGSLSSKRRWTLRRARRRAEEIGPVQFQMVALDETNVLRYLVEFMRVEEAGWKGREGTSLRLHPQLRKFFTAYTKTAARNGSLRMAFLRIGGQPASALIGVEYADRFWVLKIGYDEAFSHCSPGILLVHESIRHAFSRKLTGYEFLGSDEPWLHMWTEKIHQYLTYRLYPLSTNSLLNLGMDGGKFMLRNAFHSKSARFA
ncbi:MAG: GNAT family N-acetyltransferase [Ignavibacteriales bacterium]|nr:GNAT family N-acetyltransferase [Ignavibacteriales bacterium]